MKLSRFQKPEVYKFSPEISRELNRLTLLDNYHVIFALLQDWGLILIMSVLAHNFFYIYPIALLVIGSRQRALATISHDAAHGIVAENKKLNFLAGTVFSGFWILQNIKQYKKSHVLLHHGFLGNRKRDPDFQFYLKEGLYSPLMTNKKFLQKHIIATIFLTKTIPYIVYLIGNRMVPNKKMTLESCCMCLSWVVLICLSLYFNFIIDIFLFWIVPFFTTYIAIGYFIELSEHYPLLGYSSNIIYLARNRFSHWVEAFFLSIHNENFHLIHHLRPNIPFWNMVKAHKVMMKDEKYKSVNENYGGIFTSSNKNKPLMVMLSTQSYNDYLQRFHEHAKII